MFAKRSSIHFKIWSFLIVFSITILVFLWSFQILFLNKFYEWSKASEMTSISNKVATKFTNDNYDLLDEIAYNNGVCIEIATSYATIYTTREFNRGCIVEGNSNESYIDIFIASNQKRQSYELINTKYNNKSLIDAIKLKNGTYAFISTSLVPIDSTITILAHQFIYVTIAVLILSFIIAYFISKKLSHPIVLLNESARKMAKGDCDICFKTESDIAEMNELADSLNYAQGELSKTEELRRDLLANVSHDLKTPLTMIKAYAEMARDLNITNKEKRTQNLNVIIEESDRLNLLVNDILELSRMQSNVEELHIEEFEINTLIKAILKHYEYLTRDGYTFNYKGIKKTIVAADKKRITQVLYNLINNAVNYIGDNKVIDIKLTDKNKTILIEIVDHGKGIEEKELPLIWDRYYKVDKKYKRNTIGTGVGLSIVKNILIKHKVNYGVTSKIDKGTTFYFELEKK